MRYERIDRISHEIQRELASIIPLLKDPRIIPAITSVTAVRATRDLSYANVYISVLGDETARLATIEGLNSAKGFIRREISARVKLRITPEITFVSDDTIEHGAHINEILKDLNVDE